MPRVDLRHAHPMLFIGVVADLVVWFGVGATMTVGPNDWMTSPAFDPVRDLAPLRWFGVAFLAIGAVTVFGLLRSWRWVRRAMVAGFGLMVGFTAAFVIALIDGHNPGVTGIFVWAAFGINLLAQTGEPPVNPASAVQ